MLQKKLQGATQNKQGKLTSSSLIQHLKSTTKLGYKKDPCFFRAYRNEACKSVDEINFTHSRVFHAANRLQAGDSVSDLTSHDTEIMPCFEPDGGSEEDSAAAMEEEEKNKRTNKKKGSFGMLRGANLLDDFQEFVSKTLFANYSAPESKLSNQKINSQTCPSQLPPQVSQEGLRNYVHSRLNDNLDPSCQTEEDGESVNFEDDDDHDQDQSAEHSIESEERNNPNGSFVMDLDVGSQYGANYLPNDITFPAINFEVDDPYATCPPTTSWQHDPQSRFFRLPIGPTETTRTAQPGMHATIYQHPNGS